MRHRTATILSTPALLFAGACTSLETGTEIRSDLVDTDAFASAVA
jgi:hypothetical protein